SLSPPTATTAPDIYPLSLHDALPISRRDRRGARAAEFLSRRIRPRRRRAGADRQQERHVELPRQSLLLRPQRSAQRQRLLQQPRSEEHTSELQSQSNIVCRLLLEKKK